MRKRIVLAIAAVCLLLAALLLTDNTYQPFAKLTAEDVKSISVKLETCKETVFSDKSSLESFVEILKEIKILFTGVESTDPSAEINISFADNTTTIISIYQDSIAINNKFYLISAEDSQTMTARIEKILEKQR